MTHNFIVPNFARNSCFEGSGPWTLQYCALLLGQFSNELTQFLSDSCWQCSTACRQALIVHSTTPLIIISFHSIMRVLARSLVIETAVTSGDYCIVGRNASVVNDCLVSLASLNAENHILGYGRQIYDVSIWKRLNCLKSRTMHGRYNIRRLQDCLPFYLDSFGQS